LSPSDGHSQNPQMRRGPHGAYPPQKKTMFLGELKRHGFVMRACQAVKIDRATVYRWLATDAKFAERFREIEDSITEICESAAMERGIQGVKRPVLHNGKQVRDAQGNPLFEVDYSDGLLISLLKARSPKYKDTIKHEFDEKSLLHAVNEIVSVINKNVPKFCPHCRTALAIAQTLAKDLFEASRKFAPEASL
jgi:hypothetical protein